MTPCYLGQVARESVSTRNGYGVWQPIVEGTSACGTMTTRKDRSRRSVLKILGVTGGLALGTGTVAAGGHTFFARLSDNPSIPEHEKVFSRGRGRLDLHWGSGPVLDFTLSVTNVEQEAVEAHIRGEGRANGPIWVTLYENGEIKEDGVIDDNEVGDLPGEDEGVSGLINQLTEGNGVVTVHTGSDTKSEIAGVIRPRPVEGWIAV